jgi:hypothetical protein
MTSYCHAEIRPLPHSPLHAGPVDDGLPDWLDASTIEFQGAMDLDNNVQFAIVEHDGKQFKVFKIED